MDNPGYDYGRENFLRVATCSCGGVDWQTGEEHDKLILGSRFEITFRSSFAVALMNTSPEEQVVDVTFEDVFRDLVNESPSPRIHLTSR